MAFVFLLPEIFSPFIDLMFFYVRFSGNLVEWVGLQGAPIKNFGSEKRLKFNVLTCYKI